MLTHLRRLLFDPVDDVFAVDSPDGDEVGDGVLVCPVLLVLLETVPAPVADTAPSTGAVARDGAGSAPAGAWA